MSYNLSYAILTLSDEIFPFEHSCMGVFSSETTNPAYRHFAIKHAMKSNVALKRENCQPKPMQCIGTIVLSSEFFLAAGMQIFKS